MYRLKNTLRMLTLVICIFAFTSIAQGSGLTMVGGRDGTAAATGSGTGLGGGGIIGGEMTTTNQPSLPGNAGDTQGPSILTTVLLTIITWSR